MMLRALLVASLAATILCSGCGMVVDIGTAAFRDPCAFSEQTSLVLPAEGAERLDLRAGAGTLRVEGHPGLDEIRVAATACASEEDDLERLGVTLEAAGTDVVLATEYPGDFRSGRFTRIDLAVEIPAGLPVDVEDTSGSLSVSGSGLLSIVDGSGSIVVNDVDGSLTIEDGSGTVSVADVSGTVFVADGSGSIEIQRVGEAVRLRDGSGSIALTRVGGDVEVIEDGSGSIRVRDVGGDFIVRRDGSGGVSYAGVAGTVDIPRTRRDWRAERFRR